MSTYTQLLYQIVFSTRNRQAILLGEDRIELFKYIHGILLNKKCRLYRINGGSDHLHIVTHIHPEVAISSLVKDIKLASSSYIRKNHLFPGFNGWQDGYSAFTYSISAKDHLVAYVKNQEMHHQMKTSREECIDLLKEHGVEYDEKFLG